MTGHWIPRVLSRFRSRAGSAPRTPACVPADAPGPFRALPSAPAAIPSRGGGSWARAATSAACVALAAAACDGSRAIDAPIPLAQIDDAPWEQAFLPEERTGAISGRLLHPRRDADGETVFDEIRDAEIELFAPRPDGRPPFETLAKVVTGPHGEYAFSGVPPHYGLRASKPGLAPSIGGLGIDYPGTVTFSPGEDPVLGLQPASTFRVKVEDAKGPVAGVRVEVIGLAFRDTMRTAMDGTITVTGPIGRASVVVSDPGYDVVRQIVDTIRAASETAALRTTAVEPYSGTVQASEDDRPVAGAVVLSLDDPSQRTTTAADGTFRLEVPRSGRVAAFAAGRAWNSYEVASAATQEIRLRPCAGVAGRVHDADGAPVADARLLGVVENSAGGVERVLGPRTGADGSFDFSWMPSPPRWATRPVAVVAWHRRLGISAPVTLPVTGPIELRLSGWREARGVLLGPGGQPVANARVTADWTSAGMDEFAASNLRVPSQRVVTTGPDGAFRIPSVPAGLPVRVAADVFGLKLKKEFPAGGDAQVRFDLPPGRPLEGRVVTSAKVPIPGAKVTARLLDTPGVELERMADSDAAGVFRFSDLPDGRYALVADAPGMDLPGGGEARPGSTDAELVVEKSAVLRVTIEFDGLGPDDPRPALTLRIEDLDSPSLPARPVTIPAGSTEPIDVASIRPGAALLRADGDVWRGRVERVEVPDGAVVPVTVRVARTLRFRAILRDAAGVPMSGEQVVAVPVAGTPGVLQSLWSADGGVLDAAGFGPGTWDVRTSPRFHAPLSARVTLPQSGELELRLPPSGEVVATVRDADGKPRAEAIVSITTHEGTPVYGWADDGLQLASRFRTDAEGNVRIRGVPVGRVRLQATAGPDRRLPAKDVDVTAAAPARVVW